MDVRIEEIKVQSTAKNLQHWKELMRYIGKESMLGQQATSITACMQRQCATGAEHEEWNNVFIKLDSM